MRQWAWVQYDDPLWHQRYVVGLVRPWPGCLLSPAARVIAASPDRDVHHEDFSLEGPDIAAVRWSDGPDP
eukprot:989707-Lingulodinium_polyedra.AAC.1